MPNPQEAVYYSSKKARRSFTRTKDFIRSMVNKNTVAILLVWLLLVAIPLTVRIAQQRQQLKQHAACDNLSCGSNSSTYPFDPNSMSNLPPAATNQSNNAAYIAQQLQQQQGQAKNPSNQEQITQQSPQAPVLPNQGFVTNNGAYGTNSNNGSQGNTSNAGQNSSPNQTTQSCSGSYCVGCTQSQCGTGKTSGGGCYWAANACQIAINTAQIGEACYFDKQCATNNCSTHGGPGGTCQNSNQTTQTVGGQIKDSVSGAGISGIKVIIYDDTNNKQTVNASSDSSGNFSVTNLVRSGDTYAVRIDQNSLPSTYKWPPKTTGTGWAWDYCINPNPGTQPWGDEKAGSGSYECQKAGNNIDCGSNGNNTGPHCNFVFDPAQSTGSPTPSISISQTPTISPTPSATINPSDVQLSLILALQGVGSTGSNPSPVGGGNPNPKTPTRNVAIDIYDQSNNKVTTQQGQVTFDPASGLFKGTIDVGSLPSGNYSLFVKSDRYLRKRIPGFQNLVSGTNPIPQATLIVGDINGDNRIDILDFNIISDCFAGNSTSNACLSHPEAANADLNDDGVIDGVDYNLFISNLSHTLGD